MVLQSYYEDQKREQMQGPALQRLAQEHQQAHLTEQAEGSSHWHQQLQHQAAAAAHSESERSQESDEQSFEQQSQYAPTLLNTALVHQQHGLALHAVHGSLTQSVGPSEMYHRTGIGKGHVSPKPPLPRRPPISSEMAFLGGSAGVSDNAESISDNNV